MYKVIEKDFNVVIWPDDLQLKDVNDMIMNGMTKLQLQDIISNNTYSKIISINKIKLLEKSLGGKWRAWSRLINVKRNGRG